jgi:flagellum-specific peptidoglycan hydrolase FlgJ
MDTKAFIDNVLQGAVDTMHKHGILASVSIAQAALESGWGSHAPGNNLFGIKANGWTGKNVQMLATTEVLKGKTVHITAAFRAYPNWAASIDDHAAFLVENIRYKNLIRQKDFKIACVNLQKDGYSTSPYYSQTLISLIEQYGLAKYDLVTVAKPPIIQPVKTVVKPIITQSETYAVVSGDTLSEIASKHGTTYQALAAKNGMAPPYTLKIGQIIKV